LHRSSSFSSFASACGTAPRYLLVKVIPWLRDVAVALPLGVITFAENSQLIYLLFNLNFTFVAYPRLKQLLFPYFVA
jgi:hypothetical protein